MAGTFFKKSFTALKASVKDVCQNNSILFPNSLTQNHLKIQEKSMLEKPFRIKELSPSQKCFQEYLINIRKKPFKQQESIQSHEHLTSQEPFNIQEHSFSQKPYKIQDFSINPDSFKVHQNPESQNALRTTSFQEQKPNFYKSIYEIQKKLFKQVRTPTLVQSRNLFNFFKRDPNERKGKKRVPKLLLIQNPFKWFMLKIDFGVLKTVWDPSFELNEFKFGTKQAISRVTKVISQTDYEALNGLLTRPARLSLLRELDRNWSHKQRSLLALDREDIQISAPRKVYFIRIADRKYCDVDMAFLALKWVTINAIDTLVFAEVFARFHREYTPHCIPDWTIAYFKVIRFQILRPRDAIR